MIFWGHKTVLVFSLSKKEDTKVIVNAVDDEVW